MMELRRQRYFESANAFTALYRSEAEGLLLFFARRVADPEIALDLTAETFAEAFASRGRFRGDDSESARAWLYAIGRHQLARYFRRGRSERRAISLLGIEVPQLSNEEIERVEDLAGIAAVRQRVSRELDRLPKKQSEALRLRVVEEKEYAEVAAALGITEEAVRAHVSRGLRSLASKLRRDPAIEEAFHEPRPI